MIHPIPFRALSAAVAAALVAGACSSRPDVDPRELQAAATAISEAKQLGSERHAGQTLREAEERLALARQRIDAGREAEALRMIAEARVLAERAAAESLARQTVRAADVLKESLTTLEKSLSVTGSVEP